MAYFYKPYITADLYRTYEIASYFGTLNFPYFWTNYVITSPTPVARLLFWFVGKIGIYQILPVLAAFVCYSIIFHIINKTQRIFSISNQNIASSLFFIMSTSIYISVIGGIRMMLAVSLICFCFFRESVEGKTNILNAIFYILAIFLHATASLIIAIRFIMTIFDSRKKPIQRVFSVAAILAIGLIFVANFQYVVSDLLEKVDSYLYGDKYSDVWEYIMGFLILLLLFLSICAYWPIRKTAICKSLQTYNSVAVICMIISLMFCFEFSIFYRFGAHIAVILSTPMILVSLEKANTNDHGLFRLIDFRSVLIILSTLIALISCARGSLSSLKFFELGV